MKIQIVHITSLQNAFKGKFVNLSDVGAISTDSNWHKNSSIERTLGETHSTPTYRAYFADPLEKIGIEHKNKADYIIYDNEPNIPELEEVSQNYFEKTRKDYGLEYKELENYYGRRAIAGTSNKKYDEYLSKVANACYETYNQGKYLRYQKETTEDNLKILNNDKQNLLTKIKKAREELKSEEKIRKYLNQHIENLQKNVNTNETVTNKQKLQKIAQQEYNPKNAIIMNYSKSRNTQDIFQAIINAESITKEEELKAFNSIKKDYIETIKDLRQYILLMEDNLEIINNKIDQKTLFITKCKKQLEPLFDKLKAIYYKNNIKPIKRFYSKL